MGKKHKKKDKKRGEHGSQLGVHETKDLLTLTTGKDRRWWVAKVQKLIAEHTKPSRHYLGHGETEIDRWMVDLVAEVMRHAPPMGQSLQTAYDGNMYAARTVGMVLVLWVTRIARAKSFDPNRPLEIRRGSLRRQQNYIERFIGEVFVDETQDAEHFPLQKWNDPYKPGAKGGKFL